MRLFRCRTSDSLALLWTLSTITASRLLSTVDTLGVSATANHLVANPWKVTNPPAPDQHDRVLLKVMSLTRDVHSDFLTIAQTNPSDLSKRRVGLLWGHRLYSQTNPLLLRASFQHRTLGRLVLNDSIATH